MKTSTLIKLLALVAALAAANTLRAADGKELWDKNCASCHGKDGKGETKMGKKAGCKDYSSATEQAALTDDKALKAIKEGVKEGDKEKMKSFAEKLNDEEAKAVVAHLRTLKQ